MAVPRRSCSSFVGEVKEGEIIIGYYVTKVLTEQFCSVDLPCVTFFFYMSDL